ncbi:MAG TPA: DUF6544 family protein [Polyangiaceae bacterium]|nr:DUF6544 family protein [Polyangiaceae bacterium]
MANAILAVAIVVAGTTTILHRRVGAEVRAMYAKSPSGPEEIVTPEDLLGLPAPVSRWLSNAGIVGRARAETVRLRQRGTLHTANGAPWMPVEADQYFTVKKPGFVWWMQAIYTFDDRGRCSGVVGDRYYGASGRLERWGGTITEWAPIRGVEIPVRGEVIWHLKTSDFTFFRWEIVDVETNRPAIHDATMKGGSR